jgi:hypothetical protein
MQFFLVLGIYYNLQIFHFNSAPHNHMFNHCNTGWHGGGGEEEEVEGTKKERKGKYGRLI